MDLSQLKDRATVMTAVIQNIESVMRIMDLYEQSRPGSIAYQKLEEAILWLQVMTANVQFKTPVLTPASEEVKPVEGVVETKEEITNAA